MKRTEFPCGCIAERDGGAIYVRQLCDLHKDGGEKETKREWMFLGAK